jgi:hypothetical protein
LKLEALTQNEVARLHTEIVATAPYEANRVLNLLSTLFDLPRRWGFIPEGHPNPARDITPSADVSEIKPKTRRTA